MITRRAILLAAGVASVCAPLAAMAQQQKRVWRLGFLTLKAPREQHEYSAFVRAMAHLGYVEGRNLIYEWRFADGKVDRLRGLASELVQANVDVLIGANSQVINALKTATNTIPIVISTSDPVGEGFVKSLAKPGGNVTGVTTMAADVSAKLLELLVAVIPKLSRVGVLANTTTTSTRIKLDNIRSAAARKRIQIISAEASRSDEIDSGFGYFAQQRTQGVIVPSDAFLMLRRYQLAQLSAKYRLPAVYSAATYVEAGGLMSYGPSSDENHTKMAAYVHKIFQGAQPSQLPIEQPTRLELVLNAKTASSLGIVFSQELLVRADKMIE